MKRPPAPSNRRRAWWLVPVLLTLVAAIWLIPRRIPTDSAGQPAAISPEQRKGRLPDIPIPPSPAIPPAGPRQPSPAPIPGSLFESDEFAEVPDWLPRPADVISATAGDVSLRSDGLREGRVKLIFPPSSADALQSLRKAITNAGLNSVSDDRFESATPRRHCAISSRMISGNKLIATLEYSDLDHGRGCHCPTCGGTP